MEHLPVAISVIDHAPRERRITRYDQEHFLTYARVLDAKRDGVDWSAGVKDILYRDFGDDTVAAKRCWDSHVDRANWIVSGGLVLLGQDQAVVGALIR